MFSLLLAVTACERPDRAVRHYKEIRFAKQDSSAGAAAKTMSAPAAADTSAPAAPASAAARGMGDLPAEALGEKLPLAWDVPAGWEDLGPSGIRITTLRVQGQECTILSFPGDVGGDEANLRRWFAQINHNPADADLKRLIADARQLVSAGGLAVRLYDFAELLPADAPMSTLAGIIPAGDQTVFVKFTGDAAILAAQKAAFEELCRSIRLKAAGTNATGTY